jgi:hypothetical protein
VAASPAYLPIGVDASGGVADGSSEGIFISFTCKVMSKMT